MNIQAARELSKYRLFRPLTLDSEHYDRYESDGDLAKSIAAWASDVLLGGARYDLKVKPEYVFQVQSNRMNRMVYIIPVWDGDLVRKIVLDSEKKTNKAENGCGICNLKDIEFAGGILVLSRVFFRGTKKYRETHDSKSGWFVEDRYHFDVFSRCRKKIADKGKPGDKKRAGVQLRAIFRVFNDSVGCVAAPSWAPHPEIDKHNELIETNFPEYYPEPEDIIMNWHELAVHLNLQNTGIYALGSILAAWEYGQLDSQVLGVSLEGEYTDQGQRHRVPLCRDIDTSQPLSVDYTRSYTGFLARLFTYLLVYPQPPGPNYLPDTYANTIPPSGEVGIAVIDFLSKTIGDAGQHIGNGFFLLKSIDGSKLAAGTGTWGSAEYHGIDISTQPTGASQPSGEAVVTGQGIAGLVVDGLRYFQEDKIEAEIQECRAGETSAACQECVSESTGQLYHDIGTAADLVDVIAGVAACIVAALLGQAWVCGLTLPAAGAALVDLWDDTVGDYDYAEDMCSGVPDQSPVYDDEPAEPECRVRKEERWFSPGCDPEIAWTFCKAIFGERDVNGWVLRFAECEEIPGERRKYTLKCKYCKPPGIG